MLLLCRWHSLQRLHETMPQALHFCIVPLTCIVDISISQCEADAPASKVLHYTAQQSAHAVCMVDCKHEYLKTFKECRQDFNRQGQGL